MPASRRRSRRPHRAPTSLRCCRGALGPDWRDRFGAVVCAEEAASKKPDPLVYRIALDRLGVAADEAIAIEDSPNGLDAATAAGVATLITRSDYFRDADFSGAAAVCEDLDSPTRSARAAFARVDVDVLRALVSPTRADAQALPRDR